MKRIIFLLFLWSSFVLNAQQIINDTNITGTLIRFYFPSNLIEFRTVDVLLPSDFDPSGKTRYAVLYMHDGQNLFTPVTCFNKMEWGMDETLDSLNKLNLIKKTIVVGIWNNAQRFIEYNPEDAFNLLDSVEKNKIIAERKGGSTANAYLNFIFNDVKPLIDAKFPTKPDVKNTFMMGSSMGGLISLYALCKRSDQLNGVACLSTHWPLSLKENNQKIATSYIRYFSKKLPNPKQHRIYFDYGTITLDAWYEPHQLLMDEFCLENGYTQNKNLLTLKFEGAPHNEIAWRARLAIPLMFLLKK